MILINFYPQTEKNIQNSEISPSKSWKIDFKNGKVIGETDNAEALRQSIFLRLKTDLGRYIIFSDDYGSDLSQLVSCDNETVKTEINNKIIDCLIGDERINEVYNIKVSVASDSLKISFNVLTIFGDEEMSIDF